MPRAIARFLLTLLDSALSNPAGRPVVLGPGHVPGAPGQRPLAGVLHDVAGHDVAERNLRHGRDAQPVCHREQGVRGVLQLRRCEWSGEGACKGLKRGRSDGTKAADWRSLDLTPGLFRIPRSQRGLGTRRRRRRRRLTASPSASTGGGSCGRRWRRFTRTLGWGRRRGRRSSWGVARPGREARAARASAPPRYVLLRCSNRAGVSEVFSWLLFGL